MLTLQYVHLALPDGTLLHLLCILAECLLVDLCSEPL